MNLLSSGVNIRASISSRGWLGVTGGRLSRVGARAGSRSRVGSRGWVGGLGRGWSGGRSRRRNVSRVLGIFFTIVIVFVVIIAVVSVITVGRRGGLGSRGRGLDHIDGWRGRESRRGRRRIIIRTAVGLAVLFEGLTLLQGVTTVIEKLSVVLVLATDGKGTSVVDAIILRRI